MNAQQFNHPMFASFDILSSSEIRFFSFWGAKSHKATCSNDQDRQLAEFFYLLNGGTNFFDCCLYMVETGCSQKDFVELAEAPKEYPEHYPAEMPDAFDFEGWKNALYAALDSDGQTLFFDGLATYFTDFYEGKTIFERLTDRYVSLPVGTVLTDGETFDTVLQQNGHTTFLLGAGIPAAAANDGWTAVAREKLPEVLVASLTLAETRWNDQREAEIDQYNRWLEKANARAEKAAAKAEAKATKKAEREAAKAAKVAEKQDAEKAAAELSAKLLQEFIELTNTASVEELKNWMAENQKQMNGKGENSDRKQATDLYRALKAKADAEAKEAKKAAEAEAKAAETPTETETTDMQEVAAPKGNGRKQKQPKAQAEPIEEQVPETETAE